MAVETKLICGVKHWRIPCAKCGGKIWTQLPRDGKGVASYHCMCNDCIGIIKPRTAKHLRDRAPGSEKVYNGEAYPD